MSDEPPERDSNTPDGEPFEFDEGFGEEMGSTDSIGGGGGGSGDFDPTEEYKTERRRLHFGIPGLDELIQGGAPERSLMVVIGEAGTGKTTFALQFINRALENGEKAVYISLEQSEEEVIDTATDKGFAFDEYTDEKQLAVIDFDPLEMVNSLSNVENKLPELINEFGAERVVMDSVSLLEMMYDDSGSRRTEIYDFLTSLRSSGVTTLLTSEASDEFDNTSRFGTVEYLSDGVFWLRYLRPDNFQQTQLGLEIQKLRNTNHSRQVRPYEITNTGIEVFDQSSIF